MKVLLSGCSFSAASGWGPPDYYTDPRCWYNILAQRHQLNIENVSYGGLSNREIIHRAKQQILTNSYDLIIIQLTMTNRVWYWRESDPLSWVTAAGTNFWNVKNESERQSLFTMASEFSNHINEVERDLTDLVLLQQYLKSTPLLLVNFSNFGSTILNMIQQRPHKDEELLPMTLYRNKLALLASQLNLSHAVGFDTPLLNNMTDRAEDNMHPGIESNIMFANIIDTTLSKIL